MSNPNAPVIKPRSIFRTLRKYALLWLIPTVVIGAAAYLYGHFVPPDWEATQAVLLRDEGANNVKRHGRFDNLEAMKTAQKTVLELVRNKDALATSLTDIGPPIGYQHPEAWPTIKDIEHCRQHIALKPPKGAEFGSTEVVYLSVQERTVERALKLADAVYAQLEKRMQQLRSDNATTTIAELAETAAMAQQELETATAGLEAMEANVGTDLADLRNLNESANGDGNLQNTLQEIENELRQVNARHKADTYLQLELRSAQKDPDRLVAMPNSLLNSQPALRRLKDGLVDAQLRTAQLLGNMRKDHPAVQAALEGEQEVRHHLHEELEVAVRGLATDVEVSSGRIRSLELQKLKYETKLDRLARLRARYDNLVSEVQRRSEIVEKSQADLAAGRSALAAAHTASLIQRLDKPRVGDQPLGPGLLLLTLSGLAAGLVTGLALVFLVAPFEEQGARRWTDRLLRRGQNDRRHSSRPDGRGRRGEDNESLVDGRAVEMQRPPQPARRRSSDVAPRQRSEDAVPPAAAPPDIVQSRRPLPAPPRASAPAKPPKRRQTAQRPSQPPPQPPPTEHVRPQRAGLTPEFRATPRQRPTVPPTPQPPTVDRGHSDQQRSSVEPRPLPDVSGPVTPLPPTTERRSSSATPLPDLSTEELQRLGDHPQRPS
jgi:uncharacterized protein involved in exopolysaccharide biosynthesis